MIGIYAITHVETGRIYIGSSSRLSKRLIEHKTALTTGRHHNKYLQSAWASDGPSAFRFSVVEVLGETSTLIEREQHFLDLHKPNVYNYGPCAKSAVRGVNKSAETKAKMSAVAKQRQYSAETRAKMRQAKLGKPRPTFTAEHRQRMAAAKRLEWASGKRQIVAAFKPTAEARKQAADKMRGRPRKPHSVESKAKMSASRLAVVARKRMELAS